MVDIQSKQIKVGKLDIHYFSAGHGEPLVVITGLAVVQKGGCKVGLRSPGIIRYTFLTCPALVVVNHWMEIMAYQNLRSSWKILLIT